MLALESEIGILVAVFAGSVVAGFINTLASNGSLITLPLLIFAGLPPSVANATNRVGVLAQTVSSLWQYWKTGNLKLDRRILLWLVIPTAVGALVGTVVAVDLDEESMKLVIGAVMVVMLVLIGFNYRPQGLSADAEISKRSMVVFALIGAYGGFIQAGVSLLILGALLAMGQSYRIANGVKLFIVLCLTVPSLILFTAYGKVAWSMGVVVAVGQAIGAAAGAKLALRHGIEIWVKRLLLFLIIASLIKLFWP